MRDTISLVVFFKLTVAAEAVRVQFDEATDPMQKSFTALMLGDASGDAINMTPVQEEFGVKLTSVDQFAHTVLEHTATA